MKKTMGIIGAGAMGSYVGDIHKRHGYDIVISDQNEQNGMALAKERGYKFTGPEELAASSDVTVFSVPIPLTPGLIRQYGPLIKPGCALVDLTSRKTKAVQAALESTHPDVEIFSLHYNFRPTVSLGGKKVIMLPIRPNDGEGAMYREFRTVLCSEGAVVKEMNSPEKHDLMMDLLQGAAHAKHMVFVESMRKLLHHHNITLEELLDFSTAFFDLTFELDGRIIDGNPGLYMPIQLESEGMPCVLDVYAQTFLEHLQMVREKDESKFRELYAQWKGFMGDRAAAASVKTDRIMGNPLGIEIYFERKRQDAIQNLLRKDLKPEKYKDQLVRVMLPSQGELTKLTRSEFALAKHTFFRVRDSEEGQYVFFVYNKKHYAQKDKKVMMFSPFFKTGAAKEDDLFRVQMFSRFHDPVLNIFDTWDKSHRKFPKYVGPLIAYKVTR